MADLYTHILAGYIIGTILSWWFEWIEYPFVTVVMVGAALPDLNRLEWVIPAETVTRVVGVPFAWWPIHRLGGTVLMACLFALLVPQRHRRAVFGLLLLGASSHYVLDVFLHSWTGYSTAYLWPISEYRFPVGHYYRSTERWPAVLATVVAGCIWALDRYISRSQTVETPSSTE